MSISNSCTQELEYYEYWIHVFSNHMNWLRDTYYSVYDEYWVYVQYFFA